MEEITENNKSLQLFRKKIKEERTEVITIDETKQTITKRKQFQNNRTILPKLVRI